MNENETKSLSDKISDAQLLDRYRQGDEWAFKEIVNRYKNSLYAFLRRFVSQEDIVEDVFQETFLQLYTSRDSFDEERPLRPWLFTIAANKAKDALRKMQRQSSMSMGAIADAGDFSIDEVVNILTSYETTPDEEVSKEETAQRVRQIIAQMPENLRGILILAYFEQFSYKHMAEILSIPIGTVKSRLHTAVVYFMKKWKAANRGSDKL
ncbi:MAG TPA: sigma-70 family RNA polymerase sigma factor [Anaerohalosphaeraceae bacterium]|nr:sigma-70 family RNA polymerase sigma factor [Phycisphaerae bacterium]HOL32231.1 sigma-70 family RNA polymerase sigma factor [Anaerohalosphaeraceae bacterium]HOM76619.1 sigma-70 family RNA polymerase sigma factor [Anaerohalosphaeraceae bacterium]HPC63575.1 sigma-70 family RNA polymerase sigma factor [Anaerohalosphaeraceae bacterium]HPO69767.1 sigma-70 family RNA polymerase sigma factor [Anaerohalosphaeraceae bacterium]